MKIVHHGAQYGVTGSCHELRLDGGSLLVDCGLFQGKDSHGKDPWKFEFDVNSIDALVITHVHIDHVGRLPHLLSKGYDGPIYCSEATASLLPEVVDDALKVGINLHVNEAATVLLQLERQLRPLAYDEKAETKVGGTKVDVCLRRAGHILGSAFAEVSAHGKRVTFSGDLGCKYTPILKNAATPNPCDVLLIEGTYGDKLHESMENRSQRLREVVSKSLDDKGTTIIPAFSIGRTQELIYEFSQIFTQDDLSQKWERLPIIVDSPLAAKFTKVYEQFKKLWAEEAKEALTNEVRPLSFDNLVTIDTYEDHAMLLDRLKQKGESAIVIAAGGMCEGGRVVDFLRELLPDERTDVLFVGFQAQNTLGRKLLDGAESVTIDDDEIEVRADITQIGGYSAHADQNELLEFIQSMEAPPGHVRVMHGEEHQQRAFAEKISELFPDIEVSVACDGEPVEIDVTP